MTADKPRNLMAERTPTSGPAGDAQFKADRGKERNTSRKRLFARYCASTRECEDTGAEGEGALKMAPWLICTPLDTNCFAADMLRARQLADVLNAALWTVNARTWN